MVAMPFQQVPDEDEVEVVGSIICYVCVCIYIYGVLLYRYALRAYFIVVAIQRISTQIGTSRNRLYYYNIKFDLNK